MQIFRPVISAVRVEPVNSMRQERPNLSKDVLAVVGHIGPAAKGPKMSQPHALAALAALGQPTRLEILQRLMRAEPDGLTAGTIGDLVGSRHNTLSSHLSILARSGLVRGTRNGRSIIYRANVDGIRGLISFLVTDCCAGHPELCDFQTAVRGCKGNQQIQKRFKRRK
jgi:ArsR family transcriptional regulator, arsenate/arsenite/antimonite-responsive transcriptional repressor